MGVVLNRIITIIYIILKTAIIKLYTSILTFLAEAEIYYTRNIGIRIVKSTSRISERDMSKLIEEIQDKQRAIDKIVRLIDAEYLRNTTRDIKYIASRTDQNN